MVPRDSTVQRAAAAAELFRYAKDKMLTDTANPLVPVYLNQRIVFDLLAMLQDGIATVTKVSERNRNAVSASSELDASFGLSKAFSSLLSVNLSGKRGKASTDGAGSTRDEGRVHTPASLFFKLRELLDQRKLLKPDAPNFVPAPGDLIEFSGSLRRNPVIEAMDLMVSAMGMADAFSNEPAQKGKQRGGSGWHAQAECWTGCLGWHVPESSKGVRSCDWGAR
jgi:hypothetical protein